MAKTFQDFQFSLVFNKSGIFVSDYHATIGTTDDPKLKKNVHAPFKVPEKLEAEILSFIPELVQQIKDNEGIS